VVLGIARRRLERPSRRRRVVVVGSSRETRALAEYLADRFDVTFVSDRASLLDGLPDGIESLYDPLDGDSALASAGLSADAAVVATARDRTNLLVAQQLKTAAGVDDLVVRVNDPDRVDVFAAIGVETLCSSALVTPAVDDLLGEA
jgi:trk system potassium uptake protein TrkA